ncbi:hypothetical protein KAU11_04640 [Candidatus Babeliales bacterium]|nr:hypothetical protein [Candidatus Babeliales bacterium]
MNRTISRLLAAALVVSSSLGAATETNSPWLRLRDYRNRAEMATIFHRAVGVKNDDMAGGNISIMPFYRQTYHQDKLGKGLGVNNLSTFKIDNTAAASTTGVAAPAGSYVNSAYLIHDINSAINTIFTTVTLKPKHYAFGANLNFCMNLDNLFEGLYFEFNTAIAKAYNKVGLTFGATTDYANLSWSDFFSGAAGQTASATEATAALTKAKYNLDSYVDKGGVEDPELLIGYTFVDNDSGKVSVAIAASAPTGTDPTCEYTFEPLVGGRHFKLGLGLKACANLWESEKEDGNKQTLKALFDLNYRYAFKRDMLMTPRLKVNGAATNYGHLMLIGDVAAATTELAPAANYLTAIHEVKPGNMFEGVTMLSYCNGNLVCDLGAEFEFAESHTPTRKAAWNATQYGVADSDADVTSGLLAADQDYILSSWLDTKIESLCIFKLFGAVGVVMTDWDYPVHAGIGADVDIASKQQITPENWKIFGKVGVSF